MSRRVIRVLFFEGCPNHPPVVEMASRVVQELGVDAAVEKVEVTGPAEAERLRFLGSPTVQVDGVDIEPEARTRTDFGFSCRVYASASGLPDAALLEAALGAAASGEGAGAAACQDDHCCPRLAGAQVGATRGAATGALSASGAIVAGVLSSACCWLPLLLLGLGASSAGVAASFERLRLPLVVAAGVFLAVGFYAAYFRGSRCGDECHAGAPRARRITRAMLWVATALVLASALFPRYVGALLGSEAPQAIPAANLREYRFDVTGMTCAGCSAALEAEVSKAPGVASVSADHASGSAVVRAEDESVIPAVIDAAGRVGFTASRRKPE